MFGSLSSGGSRPIIISLGAFAALAIAGTTIALGAAHQRLVNPDTTVSYTANTSGPVVQGIQNGAGQAMEGIVGTKAGAIGVLGFASNLVHPEVALEGLAWGPSSVGLFGQGLKNTDTTHPTIGLLGTSTSGVGVEGQSLVGAGTGVFGVASDGLSAGSLGIGGGSGVLGTFSRGSFLKPGVDGESTTGTGDAAGAFGLTDLSGGHQPKYGVVGYGSTAAIFGTATGSGTSSTNAGIERTESSGTSFPDHNVGVLGTDTFGTGVLAESGGAQPTRYFGNSPIGLIATSGIGSTHANFAAAAVLEAADTSTDAMDAINPSSTLELLPGSSNALLVGLGSGGYFEFDISGNEHITGILTTSGSCSVGCSKPHSPLGKRVITYAAQSSEPTVEDYGEGQIVAGVGRVVIDAAFGRSIDANKSYLVFLTPEGDNRGLYVSQRSSTGFTVREAQGGASTLGFMYRIVAKPYGVTGARLPMIDLSGMQSQRAGRGLGRPVPQPMEPYAALVKDVGPQRAAQLLAQFKADYLQRQRMLNALPHADASGALRLGATTVAPRTVHN